MTALRSFKILVTIYQLIKSNIPDDLTVQQHCYENVKSHIWRGPKRHKILNMNWITWFLSKEHKNNLVSIFTFLLKPIFLLDMLYPFKYHSRITMVTHIVLHLEGRSSDLHECATLKCLKTRRKTVQNPLQDRKTGWDSNQMSQLKDVYLKKKKCSCCACYFIKSCNGEVRGSA